MGAIQKLGSSMSSNVFRCAIVVILCILFFGCDPKGEDSDSIDSPSYVRVISNAEGVVTISWGYVPNAEKYSINYKRSGDSSSTYLGTFLGYYYTTSAILTDLDQGVSCTIYVYAWGLHDEVSSPATTTVTVSKKTPGSDRLPPIIGFKVVYNSSGTVSLQWTPVTGAKAYFAEYKQSNSNIWHGDMEYYSTTATISGLTKGASYDFRVRAYADSDQYYAIYNDYVYLYGVVVSRR